jgi:hypothetical protein
MLHRLDKVRADRRNKARPIRIIDAAEQPKPKLTCECRLA